MALTRKSLKAMGLTDEQVESIVESHGETVSALKDEIESLKDKVGEAEEVKKERDDLVKGDYKKKYEDVCKEYDAFKAKVQADEEKSAKESAVKAYFEGKGITGKNLDIALGYAENKIGALKIDSGKIADTASLDELVGGTLASLIVRTETKGANTATPPASGEKKPDYSSMSDEDYYKATYAKNKQKE